MYFLACKAPPKYQCRTQNEVARSYGFLSCVLQQNSVMFVGLYALDSATCVLDITKSRPIGSGTLAETEGALADAGLGGGSALPHSKHAELLK